MREAQGQCLSQRRVLAVVGNYGDIFERNLGKGFQLDRGKVPAQTWQSEY
jgi:hypothetical protein